jgi:protein-disulfide isomerase
MPDLPHAGILSLKVPITARDHVIGPSDAPVSLIEYGDYQCPHCGRAFLVIEELLKTYAGRLRLVYRHFPLIKFHPQAKLAAEAAEAAAAAGGDAKFWDMHRLLFTNQTQLAPEDLLRYAQQIGLDPDRLQHDLEGHVYGPRVQEDLAGGMRTGVNGTPSFFINGVRYTGPKDAPGLIAAIESAAKAHDPHGTVDGKH